ncbi:hypothetical protein D3C78_696090 [compost metagenome]
MRDVALIPVDSEGGVQVVERGLTHLQSTEHSGKCRLARVVASVEDVQTLEVLNIFAAIANGLLPLQIAETSKACYVYLIYQRPILPDVAFWLV